MSSVPKAVREQREKSDEILKQLNPGKIEKEGEAPSGEPTGEPTGEPSGESPKDNSQEIRRLQQANNVLQGKYQAETGRLRAEVDELKAEIEKLRGLAEKATEHEVQNQRQELVDQFGDEAADAMMKYVQSSQPKVEQQNNTDTQSILHRQFLIELSQECGNWKELNTEEGFLNWLQHPSADTGMIRQEALDSAVNRRDAEAAGRIFNAYLKARDGQTGGRNTPDIPDVGSGGSPDTSGEGDSGNLSLADLKQLDKEYRTGAYRGREKEYREKRRPFEQAAAEGKLM